MSFFQMLFHDPTEAHGARIAVLGGGGKTSLVFRLGEELATYYQKVLLTSLTNSVISNKYKTCFVEDVLTKNTAPLFGQGNPLYVMGRQISSWKLGGISTHQLNLISEKSDLAIFECDGARSRPLKVHTRTDPVVPDLATQVIILIGAEAVNTRVQEGLVHRPERFRSHWNLTDRSLLRTELIAEIVTTQKGYLSKNPHGIPVTYFINKADTHPVEARELSRAIHKASSRPTFYGSLREGFWREAEK